MPEQLAASVVVCTFNRKEWLERCLDALLPQASGIAEVIVVDGPSTDGTRLLLESLEVERRIMLVRQLSLEGISAARNLGLEKAKGEVVCFIDDDAIVEPGWLRSVLEGYGSESIGGVGGPVLDLQGRTTMGRNVVSMMGDWQEVPEGQEDGGFPVMVGCNMSFRTGDLRRAGGFDPEFRYHQDETDACLRVRSLGKRIGYAPGAKVRHAWCEGSYRRDKILWYLRLRYLWGRNDALLVSKNFAGSVSFARYLGHKAMRSLLMRRGVSTAPLVSTASTVPMPISILGATLELSGAARGWRR